MFEISVLSLFALSLVLCIGYDVSILVALIFGFFLFFGYGLYKKHSFKAMASMAFSGIRTVKNILITFVLIGIITATWRVCGTIPYIVYHATSFCDPRIMVLVTFLLCCVISVLTGTAFGTAATMGVICASIATSMGVPLVYTGGAVLAGVIEPASATPVIVEDNVLIGANAVVIEGCHIGENAVVAAGAIVVGDVPANAVVAGCPAKIIKMKDEKTAGKTALVDALREL